MQDILTCAMGLDIHRDVIVACLAKGELGTEPEIEIRSFSTLIPEMRKPAAFCVAMVFHEALKTCLSRHTTSLPIFVARCNG